MNTRTRTLFATIAAGAALTLGLAPGAARTASAEFDQDDVIDVITDNEPECTPLDPANVSVAFQAHFGESYKGIFTITIAPDTPSPCGSEFHAWTQWPIVPAHEVTKPAHDVWTESTQYGFATLSLPFNCGGFGGIWLDDTQLLTVDPTPCPQTGDGVPDDGSGDDGGSGGQPGGGRLPETGSTSLSLVLAAGVAMSLGLGARRLARRPA